MSTFDTVREIIAKQLKREPSEFTADTNLAEAGFESLDVIETVFAIEEAFNIDLPFNANDTDGPQLDTVADVVAAVEAAIAKRDAT